MVSSSSSSGIMSRLIFLGLLTFQARSAQTLQHDVRARQTTTATTAVGGVASTLSSAAAPVLPPGATVTANGDLTFPNMPAITQNMVAATTATVPVTYTAGTAATLKGAPALPSAVLNIASYPALDKVPPVDSPQVKKWLSEIDMSKVPKISPTQLGGCTNASNAAAVGKSGADGSCWWTCGGCTRPADVTTCPNQGTWGASFDDGPSPETPKLLEYLDQQKLKATFFVVGSRVLSRPAMLQYEYQSGHMISVHSWSHSYLTTLTNEQIVAELGWSKQVIYDTIRVTPNTMRPPYGDIDDRVRYLSMAMGLTPIIWTTSPSGQIYDTQDWKIAAGVVTPAKVLQNFQTIIGASATLPTGFIVLAHDLYAQSVALAVEFVLPQAIAMGNLTIQPIISCMGKSLGEAYIETATGATASPDSLAGNSSSSSTGSTKTRQTQTSGTAASVSSVKAAGASRQQIGGWGAVVVAVGAGLAAMVGV